MQDRTSFTARLAPIPSVSTKGPYLNPPRFKRDKTVQPSPKPCRGEYFSALRLHRPCEILVLPLNLIHVVFHELAV